MKNRGLKGRHASTQNACDQLSLGICGPTHTHTHTILEKNLSELLIIPIMTAVFRVKAVLWTDQRDKHTEIDVRNKQRLDLSA